MHRHGASTARARRDQINRASFRVNSGTDGGLGPCTSRVRVRVGIDGRAAAVTTTTATKASPLTDDASCEVAAIGGVGALRGVQHGGFERPGSGLGHFPFEQQQETARSDPHSASAGPATSDEANAARTIARTRR